MKIWRRIYTVSSGQLRPTWMDSQAISLGGEQPSSLEIMACAGWEVAKHLPEAFTGTEARGFILEPTMNRQTQATLVNQGLMKINQIFIVEINQSVIIKINRSMR